MKLSDRILKNVIIAGVFIVPFIPLIFANDLIYSLFTAKNFVFRVLVEILFCLWFLLGIYNKKYRPRFSWILVSIIVFVSIIAVADFLGEDPYRSFWGDLKRMEGLVTLLHLLAYFLVAVSVLRSQKIWSRFFNTSIIVSVLLCIVAIFQLIGVVNINTDNGRVDSTMGNAAYFALYLLLHIFLALFMVIRHQGFKSRFLYGGVVLLEIIILYFTATRSAILALIFGFLTIAAILIFLEFKRKTVRNIALGMILSAVLIVVGFMLFRDSSFVKNSLILNRFNEISISNIKNQTRYYMWLIGLEGFRDHSIIGQGQENFNLLYNKYYEPALYGLGNESVSTRVHNIFLEWLVAGGILGLLSYLAVLVSFFYYIWFAKNKNNLNTIERSFISGLVFAYLANSFFLFDNITSYIVFFSLLAFVHFTYEDNRETIEENYEQQIGYKPVALFILAIIVLVYFFNFKGIVSAYYYKEGIDLLPDKPEKSLSAFQKSLSYDSLGRSDIREEIAIDLTQSYLLSKTTAEMKDKFFDMAIRGMDEELKRSPDNVNTNYLAGYLLYTAGRYDEALELLQKAHNIAPKKQDILLAMRRVYITRDQFDEALAVSKEAYELDPSIEKAHVPYATSLMYVPGRDEEFEKEMSFLKEYLICSPADTESRLALANAYLKLGQYDKALAEVKNAIKYNPAFESEGEMFLQRLEKYAKLNYR